MFNLPEGDKLINEPNIENYRSLIERIIFLEKEESEKIVQKIVDESKAEDSLVTKLYNNFGLDSGILISLFMNNLHREKGDSFFIDANIPHAYIHGNCLELMACSDNVIRLGLTPKLVDKENFGKIIKDHLEEMIYDENEKIDFVKYDKENKITTYDIDFIDDFKLKVYEIDKTKNIDIKKNSILLCLGGNIKVNGVLCEELGSLFVEDEIKDVKIELDDGYSSAQLYHVYGR
jgi:mannose-6-phosphate isomerase